MATNEFDRIEVTGDYQTAASFTDADQRDVYARQRAGRPSYLREDPPGTKREKDPDHHGYDRVTFPLMKNNALARMDEKEIISDEGSLWKLQQLINDLKFEILKHCVANGVHMVRDIKCEVVVRMESAALTNKAGAIVRVPEGLEEVQILLPNGEFTFGQFGTGR